MVRPSLPKPCLVFTRPSLPTPCWSLPPPRTSTAYRARPYCERLHRARPYCAPLRCVRLPPFNPARPLLPGLCWPPTACGTSSTSKCVATRARAPPTPSTRRARSASWHRLAAPWTTSRCSWSRCELADGRAVTHSRVGSLAWAALSVSLRSRRDLVAISLHLSVSRCISLHLAVSRPMGDGGCQQVNGSARRQVRAGGERVWCVGLGVGVGGGRRGEKAHRARTPLQSLMMTPLKGLMPRLLRRCTDERCSLAERCQPVASIPHAGRSWPPGATYRAPVEVVRCAMYALARVCSQSQRGACSCSPTIV